MPKTIARVGLILGFVLVAATGAIADQPPIRYQPDPDSPIGERNPQAPAEVAQFDFLIGDWNVQITWFPPQGEPNTYAAKWHNHWINDGFDVMQEWRGPYITGTEFRHFDPALGYWVGRNLYVGRSWVDTTARIEGENMVVVIEGGNPQEGAFLNRETYYDISPNQWRMKSDRSFDDGNTWEKGRYEMIATRIVR